MANLLGDGRFPAQFTMRASSLFSRVGGRSISGRAGRRRYRQLGLSRTTAEPGDYLIATGPEARHEGSHVGNVRQRNGRVSGIQHNIRDGPHVHQSSLYRQGMVGVPTSLSQCFPPAMPDRTVVSSRKGAIATQLGR
jgi:hypothetical protein